MVFSTDLWSPCAWRIDWTAQNLERGDMINDLPIIAHCSGTDTEELIPLKWFNDLME